MRKGQEDDEKDKRTKSAHNDFDHIFSLAQHQLPLIIDSPREHIDYYFHYIDHAS